MRSPVSPGHLCDIIAVRVSVCGHKSVPTEWQVNSMAIQLERRLFTLEEYEHMVEAGVFDENERIELIRGEIVEKAPIGFPHEMCVARLARLTTLLVQKAADKALVWPQNNSIRLPSHSRPEPDL